MDAKKVAFADRFVGRAVRQIRKDSDLMVATANQTDVLQLVSELELLFPTAYLS